VRQHVGCLSACFASSHCELFLGTKCLVSRCLALCFALLLYAHLTWLLAWLSCLPCRNWCLHHHHHGLHDRPQAMLLLVRTFVVPRTLYACHIWGPDMLQLSPCGQSSLQSELLSICKHVLGLCGSVAQACLLNELGLQPLQIIWRKACAKYFATAFTASRGDPLLWGAM
jgi:hypothetical protein